MSDLAGGNASRTDEASATLAEGLARFKEGDIAQAHALFQRAHRRVPSDPRAMSWYGVTLVLVEKNSNLGMDFCGKALRVSGPEPELLLNQARAHLALGQRERAVKAVMRGLSVAPDDPALRAAQASMGWRRRPIFPFLGRSNPLNRVLGKLRHRWSRRIHPVTPAAPHTLGVVAADEEAPKS